MAPQLDLALTCRRIFGEAMQVHQVAYTTFWSRNTFAISEDLSFNEARITARHIEHMTHVTIDIGWLPALCGPGEARIFDVVWEASSGWKGGPDMRPFIKGFIQVYLYAGRDAVPGDKVGPIYRLLGVLRHRRITLRRLYEDVENANALDSG